MKSTKKILKFLAVAAIFGLVLFTSQIMEMSYLYAADASGNNRYLRVSASAANLRVSALSKNDFSHPGLSTFSSSIVSLSPPQNALNVQRTANISVIFNQDINVSTINNGTLRVWGTQSGLHTGIITYDSILRKATINPTKPFIWGENVSVTLTSGIITATSQPINMFTWQFTVAVTSSTGTFAQASQLELGATGEFAFAADLDNDGDVDLGVLAGSLSILKNNGNGTFQPKVNYPVGLGIARAFAADMDNDGDLDVVTSSGAFDNSTIYVLMNNGDASFQNPVAYSLPANSIPYICAADFDGDGYIDIAAAAANLLLILRNNRNGTFQAPLVYPVRDNFNSIVAADFNKDGYIDVATGSGGGGISWASILIGNGDGTFHQAVNYQIGNFSNGIIGADLNRDGAIDILEVGCGGAHDGSLIRNNGDGTFSEQSQYGGICAVSGAAADFDGDGNINVAIVEPIIGSASRIWVLFQNATYDVGIFPRSIISADFDGDGDMDLALLGNSVGKVQILSNINLPNPSADLSISNIASANSVITGSNITYTINVTNNGPGTATSVAIADTIPLSITALSCSSTGSGVCSGSGNTRTITFPSLLPGSSETITISGLLSCSVADGTVISNMVVISSATPDPNLSNNSSAAVITASNPPPTITCPADKSVSINSGIGGSVIYPLPAVNDNCPGSTVSCTPQSGSIFPLGITVITCAATDSGGAQSSCAFTINLTIAPALEGNIGIWDGVGLWQLDGPGISRLQVIASRREGGAPVSFAAPGSSAHYRFDNLRQGTYDLTINLTYKEHIISNIQSCTTSNGPQLSLGCEGDDVFKRVRLRVGPVSIPQEPYYDIKFAPPLVMVHGIFSCYRKWFSYTGDTGYWDNYVRSQGFISFTPNYNWLMGNTNPWEFMALEIQVQVQSHFRSLTRKANTSAYPPWFYIGHSQGGLIARILTSSASFQESPLTHSLKKIFILGTPNDGALRAVDFLACVSYLGPDEMKTDFNVRYKRFGKDIVAYAGTRGLPERIAKGPNDLVVLVESVHNIHCSTCNPSLTQNIPGRDFHYKHDELGSPESRDDILVGEILPSICAIAGTCNALPLSTISSLYVPPTVVQQPYLIRN